MSEIRIVTPGEPGEIVVKKSRFIGEIFHTCSESEARGYVASVKKNYFDARHHCFAMRIGDPDRVIERSSDDGEPSGTAGLPILTILRAKDIYDVCLVVTRYFGGTLLGTGGLTRAYSDAAGAALEGAKIHSLLRGSYMRIRVGYGFLDLIRREAFSMGLSSVSESYGEAAELSYIVPEDLKDAFGDTVRRVTLGKTEAELLGQVWYYMDGKPVIYRRLGDDRF